MHFYSPHAIWAGGIPSLKHQPSTAFSWPLSSHRFLPTFFSRSSCSHVLPGGVLGQMLHPCTHTCHLRPGVPLLFVCVCPSVFCEFLLSAHCSPALPIPPTHDTHYYHATRTFPTRPPGNGFLDMKNRSRRSLLPSNFSLPPLFPSPSLPLLPSLFSYFSLFLPSPPFFLSSRH